MSNKWLAGFISSIFLASSAVANDMTEKTWDEIVSQAKQEGEVIWAVWYNRDEFRGVVKQFEDTYGIKVTIPDGTADANKSKLLSESSRERGDFDVYASGFNEFPALGVESLFVPLEALPADDGRITEIAGESGRGYFVAFWGNQTGIAYDTDKVSSDELPQTPEEFSAFWEKYPGKFGFNYENGGSGLSFYQNIFRNITGQDFNDSDASDVHMDTLADGFKFFTDNAENYVITASNAESIIRVSDGELWMVPGWEDHLAGLQKRGEIRKDIAFYVPSMGMNGGANGVAIPSNAPNPAAALVFINWLTSPAVQTSFNQEFGTVPMHEKADDTNALVPRSQRAYTKPWPPQPFVQELSSLFLENVVMER